ncbi:MAG TPA: hypothetical protein VGJ32_17355 [Solirubrobacteraceae bacterium]
MNDLRRSRRKPRTIVGKVIRAWPWLRRGLRIVRFVRRAQRVIRIALVTAAGAAIFAVVRRLRRRRELPSATYSPPPATPPGWSGGTRETGYEAGPGTETEHRLEELKGGDGGGDKSPTFEVDAPDEGAPGHDIPPPQEGETTAPPHGDPLGPNESAPGHEVPPPVEEEPPTKT